MRDHGLGRTPDTGQVDVEHLLPGLFRQFPRLPEPGDPGVGHDDVDPAELGQAVSDGSVELLLATDVSVAGHDPPAELLDLGDRLVEVLPGAQRVGHRVQVGAQVDRDDVGALLGQADRVRTALAAGRAGNEGDLACNPGHAGAPVRRRCGAAGTTRLSLRAKKSAATCAE